MIILINKDDFYEKNPELKRQHDITLELILNNLLDTSENLESKTEIQNPFILTNLKLYSIDLKNDKLNRCSKTIETWIKWYLTYMVSHKRKRSIEIIKALTKGLEYNELGLGKKLTTNLK